MPRYPTSPRLQLLIDKEIMRVYEETGRNKQHTAEILGLSTRYVRIRCRLMGDKPQAAGFKRRKNIDPPTCPFCAKPIVDAERQLL